MCFSGRLHILMPRSAKTTAAATTPWHNMGPSQKALPSLTVSQSVLPGNALTGLPRAVVLSLPSAAKPFNAAPRVVVTSSHKITSLLLPNCNFVTVAGHNVNTSVPGSLRQPRWKGRAPPKSSTHKLRAAVRVKGTNGELQASFSSVKSQVLILRISRHLSPICCFY